MHKNGPKYLFTKPLTVDVCSVTIASEPSHMLWTNQFLPVSRAAFKKAIEKMEQHIADFIARASAALSKIETDLVAIQQAETTQAKEIRDLIMSLQAAQAGGAQVDQATIDTLSTLAGRSETIAATADGIVTAMQAVPPEPSTAPAAPAPNARPA